MLGGLLHFVLPMFYYKLHSLKFVSVWHDTNNIFCRNHICHLLFQGESVSPRTVSISSFMNC